jgi:hypothetical protein
VTGTEEARRLLANITPGPWMVDPGMWQPPDWVGTDTCYRRVVAGPANAISGIRESLFHTNGSESGSERERQDIRNARFAAAAPALVASLADTLEAVAALHVSQSGWCKACGGSYPCLTARLMSPEPAGEGQ